MVYIIPMKLQLHLLQVYSTNILNALVCSFVCFLSCPFYCYTQLIIQLFYCFVFKFYMQTSRIYSLTFKQTVSQMSQTFYYLSVFTLNWYELIFKVFYNLSYEFSLLLWSNLFVFGKLLFYSYTLKNKTVYDSIN